MIFWIFFLILSVIVEVYLWWKLQASLLFKWENLQNWWLTKYFFAPVYIFFNYPLDDTAESLSVSADLTENTGGGCHSAVHHTVEDGQETVQRERLGPQQVITGLNGREVNSLGRTSHWLNLKNSTTALAKDNHLFMFLQKVGLFYFAMVLLGKRESYNHQ